MAAVEALEAQHPPSMRNRGAFPEESFPEDGFPENLDLQEEMAWLRARYLEQREELLAQRSLVQRCLELREFVEAHLLDLGDRAAELDLSLAGVSDSTARHGKAISALVEQHRQLFLSFQQLQNQAPHSLQGSAQNMGVSTADGRSQGHYHVGNDLPWGDRNYAAGDGTCRPFPQAWRNDLHGGTDRNALVQSVPPEMADCVASVLARIEEALTTLSCRPDFSVTQPDPPHNAYSSQPPPERFHAASKQERSTSAQRQGPVRTSDPKFLGANLGPPRDPLAQTTKKVPFQECGSAGASPSRRR